MKYIFLLILSLFLISCDGGLEPVGSKKGVIYGKVYYENEWLPDSTIQDIRVVAFKNFPPTDIINEVLGGSAVFSESVLPFFSDSASFSIDVNEVPAKFKYIAVARQYGTLFEWDAIGVYTNDYTNFEPLELNIEAGSMKNISITVDFKNKPPQPF